MKNSNSLLYVIIIYTVFSLVTISCTTSKSLASKDRQIKKTIAKIKKTNIFVRDNFSIAKNSFSYEIEKEQYHNFEKLNQLCSTQRLLDIVENDSGVVKCYAMMALMDRDSINMPSLIIKHKYDESEVYYTTKYSNGSYPLIATVIYTYYEKTRNTKDPDRLIMDSLIITMHQQYPSLRAGLCDALLYYPASDLSHPHIRQAIEERNCDYRLFLKLAEFKKKEDVDFIIESGYDDYFKYQIIEKFSHPNFLPYLKERVSKLKEETSDYDQEKRIHLFRAIARYQNKEAIEILKQPFVDKSPYYFDYSYGGGNFFVDKYWVNDILHALTAVEEYKNSNTSFYDDFYWNLWENDNIINTDIYLYLSRKNRLRAIETTKKSLSATMGISEKWRFTLKFGLVHKKDINGYWYQDQGYFLEKNYESPQPLLSEMIETLLENGDTSFVNKIIYKHIITDTTKYDHSVTYEFAKIAKKYKNQQLKLDAFELLESGKVQDDDYFTILIILLINYEDETVNKRILELQNKINLDDDKANSYRELIKRIK